MLVSTVLRVGCLGGLSDCPLFLGGNEDSIDDDIDDGSDAASPSDIKVPVIRRGSR